MRSSVRHQSSIAAQPATPRRVVGRSGAVPSMRAMGATFSAFPRDGYRLTLFLLIVVSISRVHKHFGILALMRPALVLAIAALGFAVMKPGALRFPVLKTRPARLMLAIVVMACISVPFGISMGNSAKFLLDALFRLVLVYVLLMLALKGPREIYQFTWAWVISCAILAWMATFVFELSDAGGVQRLSKLYTYDANDIGVILVCGIPLGIALFEVSGRLGKFVSGAILLWSGLALARSGSRGAFVGLVILVAAFLWTARHVAIGHRLAAIGVIVGSLMVAAPFGYWDQLESLTRPKEDYNWESETGRRKVALRGLEYMADRPLTGLGVDNFAKAELSISEMAQDRYRVRGIKQSAAHNTWIEAGAEMGVPGLLLWIAFVIGPMLGLRREGKRLPPGWPRGDREQRFLYVMTVYLPLSILGFAVTSTFVSFAYVDPMYYLAAMSAGVLVAIRTKRAELAVCRPGPVPPV